jgi:4'-phosphopantetheinyl transferase
MNVYWLEQTVADVPELPSWLSTQEATRLGSFRFAKRHADWQLGRWTAKLALATHWKLTIQPEILADIEIHPAPSGAPEVFFESEPADVSISLTHRDGRAMCAIAPVDTALGCDLEVIEPRSDGFIVDYLSPDEQALVARVSPTDRPAFVTLFWSIKESALKALRTGLRLDTRCITVKLSDSLEPSEEGRSSRRTAFSPGLLFGDCCWRTLQVRDPQGELFHGWWQRASGNLLRTVVARPSPNQPILLKLPSDVWPAQREASHGTIRSVA